MSRTLGPLGLSRAGPERDLDTFCPPPPVAGRGRIGIGLQGSRSRTGAAVEEAAMMWFGLFWSIITN
ncbi:hypothetical protein DV701_04335 [Ornithinimicrobium avium]|uniref:Uncharacterized protein n=1 Tax=Ornithinimicrobium avium TaxID=2283195 RepID=A0A345NKA1_9MICO|nr:hypothetical protein DV701_04335 [Ornithinimicrobium avium]